jgi:hypothetical protein
MDVYGADDEQFFAADEYELSFFRLFGKSEKEPKRNPLMFCICFANSVPNNVKNKKVIA